MPSMMLPCELTDADRLRISAEQVAEIAAREAVEAEKRLAVAGFNTTLKSHRAREHDFNESLRTGVELRDIEVEERPDYKAGIVFIHRLDTGDCVKERAIDPDERQLKNGLEGPKVLDGGRVDATDEQREATTPDEAEALRAERIAGERAERISAGVTEARERISVISDGEAGEAWTATLQFGNHFLEAKAETAAAAADGVAQQVTEILEAQEDQAQTWADVAAASKAEQDRQEVERLAAEQAADEATTPKRGFKKGLQAPKRKRVKVVDASDNEITPPSEEGEPPTPGDDGPVAAGADDGSVPPEGLVF